MRVDSRSVASSSTIWATSRPALASARARRTRNSSAPAVSQESKTVTRGSPTASAACSALRNVPERREEIVTQSTSFPASRWRRNARSKADGRTASVVTRPDPDRTAA